MGEPLILETTFLVDFEREQNRGTVGPALAFLEDHENARLYVTFTVAGGLILGGSLIPHSKRRRAVSPQVQDQQRDGHRACQR